MRAIPVVAAAAALWLLSASAFLPTEYLPEVSSWGRQFVLFSQFGIWAVIVSTVAITAEGFALRRALGGRISWILLLVFLADLATSFLALAAGAIAPGFLSFLPDSPPLGYAALLPGYAWTLTFRCLFFLPFFFLAKPGVRPYFSAVVRASRWRYAAVLAGLIAADIPRYLGMR